jgi:CDP-diacylglycerol--glycerol-3-phosphate 3-phosphatidyltransferase
VKIPTMLTVLRILLIPVFVIVYYLPFSAAHAFAVAVFAIAAITDILDGYLARSLKQTSRFGAFLDPVADKLMVTAGLVILASNPKLPYLAIPVMIIIGRELVVSGLREWMAEVGERAKVAVSKLGKIKTVIQCFAIMFLLVAHPEQAGWKTYWGYAGIYAAMIITLWSMFVYLRSAWPALRKSQ